MSVLLRSWSNVFGIVIGHMRSEYLRQDFAAPVSRPSPNVSCISVESVDILSLQKQLDLCALFELEIPPLLCRPCTCQDRPFVDDLRTMLCADALAVSRSSLHFLTFAHSRASTFYLPGSCGRGRHKRQIHSKRDGLPKRNPDNATLLLVEKPEAEVCGHKTYKRLVRVYFKKLKR